VVALGGDEDLRLVLRPPERLRVDDPVAVPLERRPQRTVGLLDLALRRVRPGRLRREELRLPGADAVLEGGRERHLPIIKEAGRDLPEQQRGGSVKSLPAS
jgi:hypothetical protein